MVYKETVRLLKLKTTQFFLLFFLFILSACSFDVDSQGTYVLFDLNDSSSENSIEVPSAVFDQYQSYKFAKLVISGGPNSTFSQIAQIEEDDRDDLLRVEFTVKGLQIGYKYSFEVWGYLNNPNTSSDVGVPIGKLTGFALSANTKKLSIPPIIPSQPFAAEID